MTAVYLTSKIDGNTYCKTNGQFTKHLRKNNMTYCDYFETYITGVSQLCNCGARLAFYQHTESYANSCGNPSCVGNTIKQVKSGWSLEKRQQDSANKKAAAALRTDDDKAQRLDKARLTYREKYGVDWGSALNSQKEKSKQTKLAKYGSETYNNRSAISSTNMAKSVDEKNEINEKRRQTNLEKYGVVNTLMVNRSPSKINRGNASIKDYTLPSGKIVGVRGAEPYALDILFNILNYSEESIIVHDDKSDYAIEIFTFEAVNRHTKKYFPDIYIPHENRIIEVKSQWWWDGNRDEKYASRLENNLRKRQAVLDKGYKYEVWIFETSKKYKILNNESDFQTKYKEL